MVLHETNHATTSWIRALPAWPRSKQGTVKALNCNASYKLHRAPPTLGIGIVRPRLFSRGQEEEEEEEEEEGPRTGLMSNQPHPARGGISDLPCK